MSRREREEALLKALTEGNYQEVCDGDLVTELADSLEASHRREDAIRKTAQEMAAEYSSISQAYAKDVLAILDGDEGKA